MANWYLGTMGFSYKDWTGSFYPSEIPTSKYLEYYSQVFNSVEVDSTFYGIPKTTTVTTWASSVPAGFKFCVKVPRVITHDLGLTSGKDSMAKFLIAMEGFQEKLGIILFQFPPSFRANQLSSLELFFSGLPKRFRYAVEIRHLSWYSEQQPLINLLTHHQSAWVAADYPNLPANLISSCNFLYIRWIGKHGSFSSYSSEKVDRTHDLKNWWEKIKLFDVASREIFGFFNDDYAGFAPGTALKFMDIVGLHRQPDHYPRQERLF